MAISSWNSTSAIRGSATGWFLKRNSVARIEWCEELTDTDGGVDEKGREADGRRGQVGVSKSTTVIVDTRGLENTGRRCSYSTSASASSIGRLNDIFDAGVYRAGTCAGATVYALAPQTPFTQRHFAWPRPAPEASRR